MAIEALEVRMARLEGAYEQISERLAGIEREISRVDSSDEGMRRRMDTQFYWLLTFILGSILIPLLNDLRF